MNARRAGGRVPRWPLFLIASPAAVAVWSGWVGLGSLCGFGIVHPLPGIVPGLHLDTAITLPVGVEAYGAYALGAWLAPGAAGPARTFARRSAVGALVLGMAGQIAYHLLSAAHAARAPWPVVVLVACLPVVTLGFGASLTHLLRTDPVLPAAPAPVPPPALRVHPNPPPGRTRPRAVLRTAPVSDDDAEVHYAAELAAGLLPSRRRIKSELHVGQDRAAAIHDRLTGLASSGSGNHVPPVPEPAGRTS